MRTFTLVSSLMLLAIGCGGQGTASLGFIPSNVTFRDLPRPTTDIELDDRTCGVRGEFDTDRATLTCFRPTRTLPGFPYLTAVLHQGDHGELALLAARSFRIAPGFELQLVGQRPAVLMALHGFAIEGSITAFNGNNAYTGAAGGASEPARESNGAGPGGGLRAAGTGAGAGGGSFCGSGGSGGNDTSPPIAGGAGGPQYGNAELVPLLAGSSGGRTGGHSGAGGGAVQLLAGTRLTVAETGQLNLGGRGGGWAGNGGGSGGAILIEAPQVFIAGFLAANGGGGGGGGTGENGADARHDGTAAPGGAGGGRSPPGGEGSAEARVDGAAAAHTPEQAGGGGGGAGRIRINSWSEAPPTLTGRISPAPGTRCMTVGAITPVR